MGLKLEQCFNQYWEFVRFLRNDHRVQHGFIQTEYINQYMQQQYMEKYWDCYYVALLDNVFVGYVGVIDNDIRVCTHPDYQGMGIGKFMIDEIMKKYPEASAKIKLDNEASINLFKSCGFKPTYIVMEKP